MGSKVRLYVDHPLSEGQSVPLDRGQANYLFAVMRLGQGDVLSLINGRDGEWDAEVAQGSKRGGTLVCQAQTAPMRLPPDLWLMFAPIKKARTDFIVEKAVEMGAARIIPVQTDYTNERARRDKLQAHAIEAAEQSGGTYVPDVAEVTPLAQALEDLGERHLMFCDEALEHGALPDLPGAWAILIGPEGGFSQAERDRLRAFAHAVSLGPRILRADTAAVAAMTLWQMRLGDWA
ncbi:16S rRNA (uracil(1498)-N(3))-methyltransferase [Salipiger sp. IMCC34102]|uniref:16S rRNA (uracil(1498)-N(3))-methyltransferase n=1 Tax=Salipiger sp. IMCC34102 TaxID=2510647 RepID=UPI00101D98D8|nr:16S rRNA (uracil(1498)-N(3))-methyltransferase [Salipiger sp. IMCC34102]RYH01626.1 16S rRNA (uracil(1498)-N(3))-methyltransferase [Salipiger sp. IMCC34102]